MSVSTHKKKTNRPCWNFLLLFVGLFWILTQFMTNIKFFHLQDQTDPDRDALEIPQRSSTTTTTVSIDFNNSSAACLLVMDDNHRLVEWLAYHHFTTNLRYLVIAIDPRSDTEPPTLILDRYPDLKYQIWTDDDFMGNRIFDKRQRLFELGRKQLTMVHRVRQKAFYQGCLERLGELNAGWTLLLDVDEYVTVNSEKVNKNPLQQRDHQTILSQPGGLYQFIQDTARIAQKQPSSNLEQFHSPCVSIPRLLFGAEEKRATTKPLHLPAFPTNNVYLDTTRWFYHAYFSEFDRNGLAKTIVNLHRISIPKPHFAAPVNPHRPFPDVCRDPKKIFDIHKIAILRVHHYLSTWETYSFRNDSRKGGERSREAWEFRAFGGQVGPNQDIIPWIQGFVDYQGEAKAIELLQGAGLPPTFTHQPQVQRQWDFQFVQDFLDPNNPQYESNYGRFLQNRTRFRGKGGG